MTRVLSIVVLITLLLVQSVQAQDDPAEVEEVTEAKSVLKIWSSQIELGAVMTTGNTEQENFKFAVNVVRNAEILKHTGQVTGIRASEDDIVTAEKYYATYQVDYKLAGDHSLFARGAYETDEFSGFEYQADATVGYTRLLYGSDAIEWHAGGGVGSRHSKFDTGVSESEFITRLATDVRWQVSDSAGFKQLLSAEIGEKSTITRSETSLGTTIAGDLAMKVAINVKHQSEVPFGRDKTDTESSITLVYSL
ncbi:MAG: DUF481 domain-containing protein [Pseudomonadales bacterium]